MFNARSFNSIKVPEYSNIIFIHWIFMCIAIHDSKIPAKSHKFKCQHLKQQNFVPMKSHFTVLCLPPLGETYCFCLVRLSVYPSVRLSHFVSAQ